MNLKIFKAKSPALVLAVILAGGFALRLWIAFLLPSYSFDEIVSVSVAEKPLAQIWSYARYDMYPPLHVYSLHFWFALFGSSELAAHSFSIFLSLLGIIAIYFLAKEIFSSKIAGLAAAGLYAFSPLFCFYGVWARMYAMLFLFSSLSFLLFWKLIKAPGKKAVWPAIFYGLCTLAALYTHLTAGLVVIVEVIFLAFLVFKKNKSAKELLQKFLAPFVFLFLAYGSWLAFFLVSRYAGVESDAWYFSAKGANPAFFIYFYNALNFLQVSGGYLSGLLAFSLVAILGFPAFFKLEKGGVAGFRIKIVFSLATFFALMVFVFSFLGLYFAKLYNVRYSVVPAIGFFLFLGYGFSVVRRRFKILALLIFVGLSLLSFLALGQGRFIEDWKEAAGFISENERPGDKIIGSLYFQLLPLGRYYHGSLPIAAPLDEKYKKNDLLSTIIYSNIYPTTSKDNVGQLDDFLVGAQRIFLSVSRGTFPENFSITRDYLLSQGFSWTGRPANAADNQMIIYIFTRP